MESSAFEKHSSSMDSVYREFRDSIETMTTDAMKGLNDGMLQFWRASMLIYYQYVQMQPPMEVHLKN
jgi:hypothetical protein